MTDPASPAAGTALIDPWAGDRPQQPAGALAAFADLGVLASADCHLATRLAALDGNVSNEALLGAAMAIRAVRLGHTCMRISAAADRATGDDGTDPAALPWPDPKRWRAQLAASALCDEGGPLVLEDDLLYLRRYWLEERQIAATLHARLGASGPAHDPACLEPGLAALFGAERRQRDAAQAALTRRLTVIAGGPGTGKTTTIARTVALAYQLAYEAAGQAPHVAMAAPTGKAAARLTEAIGDELEHLVDIDPDPRARVEALQASTLHRLLGWDPDSNSRHRYHRHNRLPHDLVIVDETSMVSLTLMDRLLDALRPDAQLVLVGDPGQLASVDAGTVLADLVHAAQFPTSPLRPALVVLTDPHRYRGGIAELAAAIDRGDPDQVIDALRDHPDDVTWVDADPADRGVTLDVIRTPAVAAAHATRTAAQEGDVAGALQALAGFRLLVAHRRGPYGVTGWNRTVEQWAIPTADRDEDFYFGRPVLVGANDATLGIYNGDIGVVVQHEDHRTVAFGRAAGPLEITPGRLPDLQTVYTMTIHKSQGSQFHTVGVLLPDPRSRILTRELFYTAVTRAQERLIVVGPEQTIRDAVGRPIDRASGLADRMSATR